MYTVPDQDGSNLANEPFDIEEVKEVLEADEKAGVGEEEERDVEHCGVIGPYKPFEIRNRANIRNCISCTIAVLWLAGMIWGIDCLVTAGSPAILILTHVILRSPLAQMLGFYYRE